MESSSVTVESDPSKSSGVLFCPSYRCIEGAWLLGVVQRDGIVDYLGSPPLLDREDVIIARQGRAPELRFRFAGPCVKSACEYWTGEACDLAARIVTEAIPPGVHSPIRCGIERSCRWRHEQGLNACGICPAVVRGVHERD